LADVVVSTSALNSTPTDITLSANTIPENNAVNAELGTFSTTDADVGDSFIYTLVSGTGDADNASFDISGSSLRAGVAFDFETKSSYSIRVRTMDSANNTFENVFTITVTNVNEAPSVTSTGVASAAENQTAVQTVTGTDPDANTTLIYRISGGDDSAKFEINSSTGVLTFVSGPDFESPTDVGANNVYDIIVEVSDGTLTGTKAVAVTVANVSDTVAEDQLNWLLESGLSPSLNLNWNSDPNNVGYSIAYAYAFGLSPIVNSGAPLTIVSSPAGSVKIVYLQRTLSGIVYVVKSGTDLAAGLNGTVTSVVSAVQPSPGKSGYTQYEATYTPGGSKGFLKVQAGSLPQ
jgi:hypothetical protein